MWLTPLAAAHSVALTSAVPSCSCSLQTAAVRDCKQSRRVASAAAAAGASSAAVAAAAAAAAAWAWWQSLASRGWWWGAMRASCSGEVVETTSDVLSTAA